MSAPRRQPDDEEEKQSQQGRGEGRVNQKEQGPPGLDADLGGLDSEDPESSVMTVCAMSESEDDTDADDDDEDRGDDDQTEFESEDESEAEEFGPGPAALQWADLPEGQQFQPGPDYFKRNEGEDQGEAVFEFEFEFVPGPAALWPGAWPAWDQGQARDQPADSADGAVPSHAEGPAAMDVDVDDDDTEGEDERKHDQ